MPSAALAAQSCVIGWHRPVSKELALSISAAKSWRSTATSGHSQHALCAWIRSPMPPVNGSNGMAPTPSPLSRWALESVADGSAIASLCSCRCESCECCESPCDTRRCGCVGPCEACESKVVGSQGSHRLRQQNPQCRRGVSHDSQLSQVQCSFYRRGYAQAIAAWAHDP